MNTVVKEPGRRSFFVGLLPLFVLGHFAHHLVTALPVPFLPFMRKEFNLSLTESAVVVTAFSLSNGFAQLPAGWIADRIGPRIVVMVGICGVAVAGVLVGISPTYLWLIVFMVLMGVAGGGYHPAAAPVISASVEPEKRGRALGLHLIGGSASFFLAPIIGAAIATVWGWRGSFIGLAVPTAILGFILYWAMGRVAGTRVPRVQPEETGQHEVIRSGSSHRRRLVAFLVLSAGAGGIGFSAQAFIPLYFVDQLGVSEATAASSLAIVYSAGLWASPLGGYISDRLGRVPVILVTSFLSALLLYVLPLASYGLGTGAILFLMGAANFTRMPASEAYVMGQTAARHRSTIYGIYFLAAHQTGAVLAPVMAYLVENFGYATSFNIAGATIAAVTLVCSVFLWGSRD